jgi:decaprenylphospho-beta-D-ribofuranose 2-oxidase
MKYPFAVAWIDHTDKRGGGVVHLGRFAQVGELPHAWQKRPFPTYRAGPWRVPRWLTVPAFGRLTAGWISALYRLRHSPGEKILPYAPYFFPLDGVGEWNRLWGSRGFIQFQFVVPRAEGFIRLWKRLREAPARSFLTVLKRLGPQKGPLAFSGPGWTLAIDLPNTLEVQRFLRGLTEEVLSEDGKIYLTKDSLLWPEAFRAAYPAWKDFLAIKAQVDPQQVLCSDLSRRVGLTA